MYILRTCLAAVITLYLGLVQSINIVGDLGPQLSPQAWIATDDTAAARWSEYHAPKASHYIHVAEEADVAKIVSPLLSAASLHAASIVMLKE